MKYSISDVLNNQDEGEWFEILLPRSPSSLHNNSRAGGDRRDTLMSSSSARRNESQDDLEQGNRQASFK